MQFLQAENITQSQFADTLSVARGSVSNILSGRNKPGYEFLESLILHYPNLNLEWLMSGKGRMYKDDSPVSASEPAQMDLFYNAESQQRGKKIEKILVFFDDNTYTEYQAKE